MDLITNIKNRIHVLEEFIKNEKLRNDIKKAVDLILGCDILLVGGNGGSAADSSHFVGELVGRFNNKMNPFPAINMTADIACLTAIANDIDYGNIFNQYIEAFSKFNSAYLFISTSGKSKNILNAIELLLNKYNNKNIILLTGANCNDFNDRILTLNIPTVRTEYIQEAYLVVLHEIASEIKTRLSI